MVYQNILYDSANQLQPCFDHYLLLEQAGRGGYGVWVARCRGELVSSLGGECLASVMTGLLGYKIRSSAPRARSMRR